MWSSPKPCAHMFGRPPRSARPGVGFRLSFVVLVLGLALELPTWVAGRSGRTRPDQPVPSLGSQGKVSTILLDTVSAIVGTNMDLTGIAGETRTLGFADCLRGGVAPRGLP